MLSLHRWSSGHSGLSQSSGAVVLQFLSPYHMSAGTTGGRSTRPVLWRDVFFGALQSNHSRETPFTKSQLLYGRLFAMQ
jgi:hypothetical protein